MNLEEIALSIVKENPSILLEFYKMANIDHEELELALDPSTPADVRRDLDLDNFKEYAIWEFVASFRFFYNVIKVNIESWSPKMHIDAAFLAEESATLKEGTP